MTAIHRFTIRDNKCLKTITDYRCEDKYNASKYKIRINIKKKIIITKKYNSWACLFVRFTQNTLYNVYSNGKC